MAHHSITSARNGLKIVVPLRPYGTLQRFSTRGDNELIFTEPRKSAVGTEAAVEEKAKTKRASRQRAAKEETQAAEQDAEDLV